MKLLRDGAIPPEPEGIRHFLAWDLSPLRPWEYWEMDAGEWTEAQAVRQAFDAGVNEYRHTKAKAEAQKRADAERLSKLKSEVNG